MEDKIDVRERLTTPWEIIDAFNSKIEALNMDTQLRKDHFLDELEEPITSINNYLKNRKVGAQGQTGEELMAWDEAQRLADLYNLMIKGKIKQLEDRFKNKKDDHI